MGQSSDDAVRSTNDDAAVCKLSAVTVGYYSDPYVQYFAKPSRKQPLINRGYYARVHAVDALVKKYVWARKARWHRTIRVFAPGHGLDRDVLAAFVQPT